MFWRKEQHGQQMWKYKRLLSGMLTRSQLLNAMFFFVLLVLFYCPVKYA